MLRVVLAVFYGVAGIVHVGFPSVFLRVMPEIVPYPVTVIVATGVCELMGAAALLTPRWRKPAGIMLALYAVCVFPANLKHAWLDVFVAHDYATLWYHIPRMPLQALLIWAALFAGGAVDWPWRRKARDAPS